ncbi:hypothetical protein D3C71_2155610 [compost metagenome]
MTAATLWVLLAFLPASFERPPVMVIERFATQAECLDLLAVFPSTVRVSFDCLPSQRIDARPLPEPQQ